MKPGWSRNVLIGTSLRNAAVSQHFSALAAELVNRGLQAALLVHGPEEDISRVDPRTTILRWPSRRPTSLADAMFFGRLIHRLRPGCVISNFGAMAIMMTLGGICRVPVRIHWYHTLSSQIGADWPRSRFALALRRLRARFPLKFVTHAVCNSAAAKQDLIHTFGVPVRKCSVFWNCLEDPLVNGASSVSPRPRRFVCAGRFDPSKGQDILLKATAELVRQYSDVVVEFAGDGRTRAACQELADQLGLSKNTVFTGIVPHQQVLARLAGAWATVVPSRTEAFGLTNIESMAVGVPVIGSSTGGIAEVVREGIDGFLFPPGDHVALARCMARLIEDEDLRARMAADARQRYLDEFEISRAVKAQAQWIHEQIEKTAVDSSPESSRCCGLTPGAPK